MKLLCVVCTVLICVACSGSSRPVPPALTEGGQIAHTYTGNGPKVVVLGDSLTVLSWDQTYNDLTGEYAVSPPRGMEKATAVVGSRIVWGLLPPLQQRTTPPRVLMSRSWLGTNDVWRTRPMTSGERCSRWPRR